jgi:hypothetical protein
MFITNPHTVSFQNKNHAWRYPVIVVRNLQSTHQISNLAIKALVQQRINDIGREAFDSEDVGYFIVVEATDTIAAINAQVGFDILRNGFTGIRFDEPGYGRFFEFIEEFSSCYDMVIVISDDGFGVELFIPKIEGVDPDLLAMCRMYAFKEDAA